MLISPKQMGEADMSPLQEGTPSVRTDDSMHSSACGVPNEHLGQNPGHSDRTWRMRRRRLILKRRHAPTSPKPSRSLRRDHVRRVSLCNGACDGATRDNQPSVASPVQQGQGAHGMVIITTPHNGHHHNAAHRRDAHGRQRCESHALRAGVTRELVRSGAEKMRLTPKNGATNAHEAACAFVAPSVQNGATLRTGSLPAA